MKENYHNMSMDAAKRKKLLIVDDDETHLDMAEYLLKDDYEISCERSGKAALEYMLHTNPPDLILLDILMPNMDGWETFNRIKAISSLRNIPIVFLTSVSETTEIERAFKMGAADFIKKPYDKPVLVERINKALAKT